MDPDNIDFDGIISGRVPRLITADDYHEFDYIQDMLKTLGMDNACVTEVGFLDGFYVALVHTNTNKHQQLIQQLVDYYST